MIPLLQEKLNILLILHNQERFFVSFDHQERFAL